LSAAASASERTNAAYSAPKGYENNYQLRNGGAMTDVESSSMSVSSDLMCEPRQSIEVHCVFADESAEKRGDRADGERGRERVIIACADVV